MIANDRITPGVPVPRTPRERDCGLWKVPEQRTPAWVSGLWCALCGEPPSEPGSAAKSEGIYGIKSLHSRCLFRLSHWRIAQRPRERPETHTRERAGGWEALRKKHRARPPVQLGNKAMRVCGLRIKEGPLGICISQAAALGAAGSASPPRDGLSGWRKESHHNFFWVNVFFSQLSWVVNKSMTSGVRYLNLKFFFTTSCVTLGKLQNPSKLQFPWL